MRGIFPHRFSAMVAVCILAAAAAGQQSAPSLLQVKHSQNTNATYRYDVFEITFQHANDYVKPYLEADIDVVFTTPAGKELHVGGFLYGCSGKPKVVREEPRPGQVVAKLVHEHPDVWKARLAPMEVGNWKYRYVFTDARGGRATGEGSFLCVIGRRPNRGFVRQNPANPFRWVFDDGSPYYPIGIQDGWGDREGLGTMLASAAMEGPFRLDRNVELPRGPMFVRSPSMNPQNADVYFRTYGQCGFNLLRYSQRNNAPALDRNLEEILLQECIMVDELLTYARKYNFRTMYGIFGNQRILEGPPLPDNASTVERVKRFIKYSVDRWGAYADFWQLLNEKLAHDDWLNIIIPYIRDIDPYRHPITTSWQRPDHPLVEINAPHWYHRVDTVDDSDEVTAARAKEYKKFNKPVIIGEHGNNITCIKGHDRPIPFEYEHIEVEDIPAMRKAGKLPPGAGGTWDPDSAFRMRVRNWTALFREISFVYWNTSYARDGHVMNMWLGPQERSYVRAMQDFAYRLDKDVKISPVTVSDASAVRAYGLASKERAGAYLFHFKDVNMDIKGLKLTLEVPKAAKAYWYDPATAAIKRIDGPAGRQTLEVPPFKQDLALLISPDGPPDIDHDGRPNDEDDDNDNDGVPDAKDAFPLDKSEWADADGDLIGDNMDADIDGDGKADDRNHNGIPDNDEMDFDGDGVSRAKAVPWDAFPNDPKEWKDTDGDGIGDNADTDKDGDGWSDQEEIKAGTDPLRKESFPLKEP